jgi:hypothetical protein
MSNQSAFPWAIDDGQKIVGNKGMTLRDYFAAKAMQGLIHVQVKTAQQMTAETAYEWADAMMKAREL